jgi:NADPH-dependent F420 reductase
MTNHEIAVIGGTGAQGKGLAYRFARHGRSVVIGSRSAERAAATAESILARLDSATVAGASNDLAAAEADVVVLAVPYDGHDELVESLAGELRGKLVISCVNPLGFDKVGPFGLEVAAGSAAETVAELVPTAQVVGAFHHVSAVNLWSDEDYLDHEDVLVCGDDPIAKETTMTLARTVTGRDGIDAGPLRVARQLEPLTAVLIHVNKRYKIRSGIRISGM